MDAIDLITKCRELGAVLVVEGDQFKVKSNVALPLEIRRGLKSNRTLVLQLLRLMDDTACGNPLTDHGRHEFEWECIADSCMCYREWRRPLLCQGMPCRWIWPIDSANGGL